MTVTIQDAARQTGLSGPTLRYYEQVGLVGPIARDELGHRLYAETDLDALGALACLRATGVGIEDMRTYQANRRRGGVEAAAEQRDLLLRHAARLEDEIAAQRTRLTYLREKAALWDARARQDAEAEEAAQKRAWAAIGALR